MKLHFRVKGSLATDSTHREKEFVEQCKAQSRSKWHGENLLLVKSLYWASASQTETLGAHEFWRYLSNLEVHFIPQHIQPQQKLGNTHTENTTRIRNIAMWLGSTTVSLLFVHLPPKHVKDKSWAKEMNKHSKSYSGLWSKAQGNQDKSSRANHMSAHRYCAYEHL